MAIRDADGNRFDGSGPIEGVTVLTEQTVVGYVERTETYEKIRTADGAIIVQAIVPVHARELPRGLAHAPDGTIRTTADGKDTYSPTDVQYARAESVQRHNAAREAEQAALRHRGLSAKAIAQGYFNDGTMVRDRSGKPVEVCGHIIDQTSFLRQHMMTDRGVL